jgi:thiol:disulfide interchange protein DsbA
VRQANAKARAAKVTGTPSMMVNGKYFLSSRKAGSQANMLKIADYLLEQERAAKGS